jgi:hypothetical protein
MISKLYKNWTVHNVLGHPLMQFFILLHMPITAKKVHDGTLPPDVIPS